MPMLRNGLKFSLASSARVMLAAGLLCTVSLPAHAFMDDWFGSESDKKAKEQATQLGAKRVPERNAGDRTSPQALQRDASAALDEGQAFVSAPVVSQYPAYPSALPEAQPLAQALPEAPVAAYVPAMQYPQAAAAPSELDFSQSPAEYDAMAYGAPAPVAAAPQFAAAEPVAAASAPRKTKSLLDWVGLSEDTPSHENASAHAPVAAAPAQAASVALPAAESGVEYYDADGYPILAATPANPATPDHAANQAQMQDMIALNQAGEGTRAAFMAHGEQAFAPVTLPSATAAPSAMDELALGDHAGQVQYAPQPQAYEAPQMAAAVEPAPVYAPAPQQQQAYEQPVAAYVPPAAEPVAAYAANNANVQYDGELLPPPGMTQAANQYAPAPVYVEPAQQAPMQAASSGWGAADAQQAPAYYAPQAVAPEQMQVALAPAAPAPSAPASIPAYAPVAELPSYPAGNAAQQGYDSGDSRIAPAAQPTAYDVIQPQGQARATQVRYLPDSRYAARRMGNAKPGLYATN